MNETRNIAVVGGGIAGLASAWLLSHRHRVTLFEANDYVGGHTNTVDVDTADGSLAVDTGFVVFNERNYPNLIKLFDWLDVASQATEMSFSVSADNGAYEYAGTNLNTLFGQRSLLLSGAHWRLLGDVIRFNRYAKRALANELTDDLTLGEFLAQGKFDAAFQHFYLLPMGAAIWSCPVQTMREFPARSFLQFFLNHGLLDLTGRPRWRTVSGGSQSYVAKMLRRLRGRVRTNAPVTGVARREQGVAVRTSRGEQLFDAVVIGCHADQALRVLDTPTPQETAVLVGFRYQDNHAVLHSDTALMPRERRVWSSWNYLRAGHEAASAVYVTYWMNRLQQLRGAQPMLVSLNPAAAPDARKTIAEFTYEHPVLDTRAQQSRALLHTIQGQDRLWYCGSYFGYGFHEDALRSALDMCAELGVLPHWLDPALVTANPEPILEAAT
ncbi:MAG: FAD-dependent oxidoreductase [Gammaproteobacteria bacterium]|nr:FAD-dependent oxidoreductase [Gammaproteobacteria bacterium]